MGSNPILSARNHASSRFFRLLASLVLEWFVEQFVVDVDLTGLPLHIGIKGDILNQFKAHLTGKLLHVGVLFQTLHEQGNIFLVLPDRGEFFFKVSNFCGQFFLFGLVFCYQLHRYILRNLAEDFVLVDILDQRVKLLQAVFALCELLGVNGILLLVVFCFASEEFRLCLFLVLHDKLCEAANIFKHNCVHILHFDVVTGTISLAKLHVRCAVVIMAKILSRLLLTAVCGIVPRKADFVSAVLAVDQTTEICNISAAVTLALRYRLLHFTHSVPKLLRNNSFVRILHNDHIFLVIFDDLMILIADRSGAELNKMSEIGVVVMM